jgi:hypothetical protein
MLGAKVNGRSMAAPNVKRQARAGVSVVMAPGATMPINTSNA